VRLTDKAGILAAMERRLANDRATEIGAALEKIGKTTALWLGTPHEPRRARAVRDHIGALQHP